jgi:hypothetical protein
MLKLLIISVLSIIYSNALVAQIVTNETQNQPKTKKDTTTIIPQNIAPDTVFTTAYFTIGYFNTFRTFLDETPYQSLKEWELQTATQNLGLNLGMYLPIANHFSIDLGINYLPYGETFSYADSLSDSTFSYTNKYQQVGLPVKLKFTFFNAAPNDLGFKPFIALGVVPSTIFSNRYFSSYTTKKGFEIKNDIQKKTNNLSTIVFAGSMSVGFTYKTPKVGFKLVPEFRYNFSNTYAGVLWQHNLWAWGVSAGIELDL